MVVCPSTGFWRFMHPTKTALHKTLSNMRHNRRCKLISFTLCLSLALPASAFAASAADYNTIPQPLRQLLCSTSQQKEQEYVDRILKLIERGRNPDSFDQEDITEQQNKTLITMRAMQVSNILLADYDADGKVSKNELLRKETDLQKLRQSKATNAIVGQPNNLESNAEKIMLLDLNKDGSVDFDEMRNIDTKLPVTTAIGASTQMTLMQSDALLELAPDKQRLTKVELEKQARAAFAIVDVNHDATLSSDECGAYKNVIRGTVPAQKLQDLKGIDLPQEYLDSLRVRDKNL